MHIFGGLFMFVSTRLMIAGASPGAINWIFFGYMLTFFPTLVLTNTIAMRNMKNPDRDFPPFAFSGRSAGFWLGLFCPTSP